MVEGSDPDLRNEYIVIGGHLDGIGPWPRLHSGASDNASGSAIVIELAHAFSKLKRRPKRSAINYKSVSSSWFRPKLAAKSCSAIAGAMLSPSHP
jgi:hypothetical protein